MKIKYCLPENLRTELRKNFGILYEGNSTETSKRIIRDIESPTRLITVGDITTFNLLKEGVVPSVSLIDNKTKRGPVSEDVVRGTSHPRFNTVIIENPPGTITEEMIDVLSKAIQSEVPTRIIVNGEEDLAALPAIVLAPISSVVIYGFPEKGAVIVKVTDSKKKEIQHILDRMKCTEEK